jgi:hypothetical protein
MIKKYIEFINESLELILESNVVYSKNFKTVIGKIDHTIAKSILEIENQDHPVRNNYLDVNLKENDKLGFIPDRKAQEILNDPKEYVNFIGSGGGWLKNKEVNKSLFDKLGYTYEEGTEPYKAESIEVGEVISKITSDTSGKTYAWVKFQAGQGVYNMEKLRAVDNKEKALWSRGRQEIFVGRGIRALLTSSGIKFTDKELEEFVNLYKSTVDKMNDKFQYFELTKGSDIAHWYHWKNYLSRSGSLGSSCMSNVDDDYFDIYMSNPDVCQLLILKSQEDETKIIGRALLWTTRDGKKFMDRIYSINDSDVQLFRDYGKENGWYCKYYNQSTDSGYVIDPNSGDNMNLGEITIAIRKGYYNSYPYLDTLKYFNPSAGTLSNKESSNCYTLESTDGDLGNGDEDCDYCDGSGRVDCDNCDGDGSWECGSCSGSGDKDCDECDGTGEIDGESCGSCDGGKVDCDECDGGGSITCDDCDGDGRTDCYECN